MAAIPTPDPVIPLGRRAWEKERVWRVRSPLSVHIVITRGWILVASLATAAALLSISGAAATAVPQPTVAQVEHELTVINNKAARLGQAYDEVVQQLSLANQRLSLLNRETKRYRATFDSMRKQIDRIAAVAYEQGDINTEIRQTNSRGACSAPDVEGA